MRVEDRPDGTGKDYIFEAPPILPDDPRDWLREIGAICDHEFMTDIGRVKCGVKQGHTGDHICHYEHTFTCKQGETHDS